MYNSEVTYTQNFVDSYGMMLRQNESWDVNGDNGRGDSIGSKVLSDIAYGRVKDGYMEFIWSVRYDPFRIMSRHPEIDEDTLSRDHVIYYLIYNHLYYAEKYGFNSLHADTIPWKLSEKYSQTIDMWLWIRTLAGSKFYSVLFYILEALILSGVVVWNRGLRWVAGFKPERTQGEWATKYRANDWVITPFQLRIRKLLYPMYALHILAWQLYVLPNSLGKRILHRLMRPLVDRENLLVSMLIGRKVTLKQIEAYRPMNSYRWSTRLDETNDRDIYVLNDPKLYEFNAYDRDILFTMYEKLNNK